MQGKKYYTQNEVADRFRVTSSTVINWRKRGVLRYFQVPGSRRILYPVDAIEELENKYVKQKGGSPEPTKIKRKRPVVSSRPQTQWRIS